MISIDELISEDPKGLDNNELLVYNVAYALYNQLETQNKELTMDHIVPIIRGGRSTKNNVVPACKECNNKKKHSLPMEWEEYLDKLKKEHID